MVNYFAIYIIIAMMFELVRVANHTLPLKKKTQTNYLNKNTMGHP